MRMKVSVCFMVSQHTKHYVLLDNDEVPSYDFDPNKTSYAVAQEMLFDYFGQSSTWFPISQVGFFDELPVEGERVVSVVYFCLLDELLPVKTNASEWVDLDMTDKWINSLSNYILKGANLV